MKTRIPIIGKGKEGRGNICLPLNRVKSILETDMPTLSIFQYQFRHHKGIYHFQYQGK